HHRGPVQPGRDRLGVVRGDRHGAAGRHRCRPRSEAGPGGGTARVGSAGGGGAVPRGDPVVPLGGKGARAAVLLELALPGGAYVYQGDELGLEEVEDLPEGVLQDPVWKRSGHTIRGRDGCRVPIPWSGTGPPFGFGSVEHPPWLPQPAHWADLTVAAQDAHPASMLNLYRAALAERRRNPALGDGALTWDDDAPQGVLSFTREPGFRCVVNFGPELYEIPRS